MFVTSGSPAGRMKSLVRVTVSPGSNLAMSLM